MQPPQLNLDTLEALEEKLVPVLKRRGVEVQAIQPIGILGRGASSTVFSLLIDGDYHVMKVYTRGSAYQAELRNRRRLIWPPKLVLTSRHNQNSLGYDLMITKVPEGRDFCSDDLLDSIADKLGQHMLELHRIKRKKRVTATSLAKRLEEAADGAEKLVSHHRPDILAEFKQACTEAMELLVQNKASFRVEHSLIHGDLWWNNIIIARDEVFLIDWETMKTADFVEDLAFLWTMFDYSQGGRKFWRGERNMVALQRFMKRVFQHYEYEYPEENVMLRIKFYVFLLQIRRLNMLYRHKGADADSARVSQYADDALWYWHHISATLS